MKTENNIRQHNAPFVTPQMYAEITGQTLDAVRGQIKRGMLPVLKRERNERGLNFINMRALEQLAIEQAEQYQDWKSAI
ncbi:MULTISPECIES: hypothetical protein [Photobacterium]|uniref:DNA-binding protein n=1 Tax=Photobacterium arenosum TaxID=2774143 RepID=A0ABR9BKU3_9GAMM|nr:MULTISPECIES: hypothetical protein [Photobacterium]MBD8513168.1 hypothetical protein [Photobacterium arenosum]